MANNNRVALTQEQLAANRNAIHAFIAQQLQGANSYGKVIVIPEFTMDANGAWTPDMDSVIRVANNPNDASAGFIRLGTKVLGDGLKEQYRFTNAFQDTAALANLLTTLGAGAGSVVPGKLVVEESLVPFSTTNPARDIKYADQAAGIACKVDDKVIYRRIVHTTKLDREDINIAHTNRAEISANAATKWGNGNNQRTMQQVANNLKNNAPLTEEQMEQRVAALMAIPKSKRTDAEKKELAELQAQLQ